MKLVLLITVMFTLVLVHGQNQQPCLPARNNAYKNFVHSHILCQAFNRNSKQDWNRYLQRNNLCHKRQQIFMERSDQRQVERVCQGHGWRFRSCSNLCISNSPIRVFNLTVDNNCRIQEPERHGRYVVVACGVIDNVCLPVNFEVATNRGPNKRLGHCKNGEV